MNTNRSKSRLQSHKQRNLIDTTDSKSRATPLRKAESRGLVTKNLMKDFEAFQKQLLQKKQSSPLWEQISSQKIKPKQPQIEESQQFYSQQNEDVEVTYQNKKSQFSEKGRRKDELAREKNEYDYPLPKSYVLALSGLQEGIRSRDSQISQLKQQLKTYDQKIKELQNKMEIIITQRDNLKDLGVQKDQQISYLRRCLSELKLQYTEDIKIKADQIATQQLKLLEFKKSAQKFRKQSQEILLTKQEQIQKEWENRVKFITQVLEKQIFFLKDLLAKEEQKNRQLNIQNIKQSQILSELEAALLITREEKAKEQKMRLDNMQFQIQANREILKDITTEKPPLNKSSLTNFQNQGRNNFKELKRSIYKAEEYRNNLVKDQKLNREEKSAEKGEMVSQYRQLLRQQKELVSLGYQMQMLERSMTAENGGKAKEAQKAYCRLRREFQRKEDLVRQLRLLLNPNTYF